MRMIAWFAVVAMLILGVVVGFAAKRMSSRNIETSPGTMHIVLIGASIGQSWHLAEWPKRTGASGVSAESIAAWQFDKTEAVDEVLMRPGRKFHLTRTYLRSLFEPPPRKPDVVILKECSSYFPGDLEMYKRSTETWVRELRKHSVVLMATVVPVTQSRSQQTPGKQEGLIEYNNWVRQYAEHYGIKLLDLEAALRTDDLHRYLRDDFAAPDGSHLNTTAYKVLDGVLYQAMSETNVPEAAPQSSATAR